MDGNDYAARLQAALKRSNMSTADLADALGVTYQAVKKVLDGTSKAFNAYNTVRAAHILKVNSEWLATGEGQLDAPWPEVFPGDLRARLLALPDEQVRSIVLGLRGMLAALPED